ncbi:MAG: hypothetical protein SV775_19820 [Thermodesulfobacteriota bacterium]|nr:hypothetical protein [Thermodesulfobacteriota bacterium]
MIPVVLALMIGGTATGGAQNVAKVKEFRIEHRIPKEAVACIQCHKQEHLGLFADWAKIRHTSANMTCYGCHKAESFDPDVSKAHYKQYERSDTRFGIKEYRIPVSWVVTLKDSSFRHPDEAKQFSGSKHANTLGIIWRIYPWLNDGMNSDIFVRLK